MKRAKHFTLVEVLAVIVVIMILVAILMPTTNLVLTKAEVHRTRAAMKAVEMAVSQYKVQYKHLPWLSNNNDQLIGKDNDNNRRFISILTGVTTGNALDLGNKRDIQFLEPPKSIEGVASGVSGDWGKINYAYVDAWGRRFKYKIDCNYDGEIDGSNGGTVEGFSASDVWYRQIVVWSGGPDENFGNTADNVHSFDDE
jgi:type II secretory pathway pseudopilin PulG